MTRILIVDDNEQNLYMLEVLLSAHGFQALSATNGAEALALAQASPPRSHHQRHPHAGHGWVRILSRMQEDGPAE